MARKRKAAKRERQLSERWAREQRELIRYRQAQQESGMPPYVYALHQLLNRL